MIRARQRGAGREGACDGDAHKIAQYLLRRLGHLIGPRIIAASKVTKFSSHGGDSVIFSFRVIPEIQSVSDVLISDCTINLLLSIPRRTKCVRFPRVSRCSPNSLISLTFPLRESNTIAGVSLPPTLNTFTKLIVEVNFCRNPLKKMFYYLLSSR